MPASMTEQLFLISNYSARSGIPPFSFTQLRSNSPTTGFRHRKITVVNPRTIAKIYGDPTVIFNNTNPLLSPQALVSQGLELYGIAPHPTQLKALALPGLQALTTPHHVSRGV